MEKSGCHGPCRQGPPEIVCAQGGAAKRQRAEGLPAGLHGADSGKRVHVAAQVMKLFGSHHVRGLHHDIAMAPVLQVGNGGKRALHLVEIGGNIRMLRAKLCIQAALLPDPAHLVGGKGYFQGRIGKGLAQLFFHPEEPLQAGLRRGAEGCKDKGRALIVGGLAAAAHGIWGAGHNRLSGPNKNRISI